MSTWALVASVLPLAVAKMVAPTIVPIPIALLTGRHGRAKSAVFTLGWFLGPIVMGNLMLLLVAAFAVPGEAASTIAHALMLGLGLLCLLMTLQAWRLSASLLPIGRTSDPAAWSENINRFSVSQSFFSGALLSGSGFKGTALLLSTLAVIAETNLDIVQAELALVIFAAIGSLLVGTPVAIAVYFGERADAVLDALRAWLDLHGQAVVLGTLLVLGVWLVGKGLEGLLG
ncbi:MAG TPA: GAP family protein [Chloroflexota bacterium]|nr:GAP family protein [Chloroflexota bacterium]